VRLPIPKKPRVNTPFNARLSDEDLKRANEQSKQARRRNIAGMLMRATPAKRAGPPPRWEGLKVLAVPAGRYLTRAEIEGIKKNNSIRRQGVRP
jgi:hypothetical protein